MFDFDVVTGPSSLVRPAEPDRAPQKPAQAAPSHEPADEPHGSKAAEAPKTSS